jgi:L,D-transpeptidase YcbB
MKVVRCIHRLPFLALLLITCAGCGKELLNRVAATDASTSFAAKAQRLSSDGAATLCAFIEAGELPDLHWPNFRNYQNEVKEFYDANEYSLAWVRDAKATVQAHEIIKALENAEDKGLRPEDYDASRWAGRILQIERSATLSESDLVRFDLALTVSTMRYVSDLHVGRVNPRLFHFDLTIDHTKFDLSEFLRQELVNSLNVDSALQTVEPPFPVYRRTEAALKTYLALASRDHGPSLPILARAVRPGDSYGALSQLANLLALLGDLPPGLDDREETYQGTIVNGVKHFQERHGLEPNGIIDAATLRELNTPLIQRISQLELTMERLRWLPHEFERPPIVVNIPEFRLHADDEAYNWAFSMKVVVGKAYGHKTPVFASEIRSVVFRPYWDVPTSILRAELIPHIEKDFSYFAENSYEVVDQRRRVVSEGVVDKQIIRQLRSGELGVRQKPGPSNALGLVKFVIPSQHDVYLHGTPAGQLFSRPRRDFSHGCIRVEDTVKLAAWVLRDKPVWTNNSIQAAMNGDEMIQVKLDKPIPVLILYSTAVVMENGEVRFFADIYGHDAELERALADGYPYSAVEVKAGE